MALKESSSLRWPSFELINITPILLPNAYWHISWVRPWFRITQGQVLQLNITNKPFSFIVSFMLTSLPVISFIFVSAFGKGEPMGNGSSFLMLKARMPNVEINNAEKKIFFMTNIFI